MYCTQVRRSSALRLREIARPACALTRLTLVHAREATACRLRTCQWFVTVFTNNFPFDTVVRIWDAFLNEGWKVTFRVALALLQLSHGECRTQRDGDGTAGRSHCAV